MPTAIAGTPTSEEVVGFLAAEARPVLLSFSRGKDAIAAWLQLQDAGIEVIPYHLDLVPGLKFVDESILYFEEKFKTRIIRLPHPSMYRWFNEFTFQAPENCAVIDAAMLPSFDYEDVRRVICEDYGLDSDTWSCHGVRACDSIVRRANFARNGPLNKNNHKAAVVWDWTKGEVLTRIAKAGIELPIDYKLWKRSFDGLDFRFVGPMKTQMPDDYARILEWFPLVELEIFREQIREQIKKDRECRG